MTPPDFDPARLSDPSFRASVLQSVVPTRESAKQALDTLRSIFHYEMSYRVDDAYDGEYFENLYWCAFLLYLAGDPSDVPLMSHAKNINMDTGCGFDSQNFVGAGISETIKYLEQLGEAELADYIKGIQKHGTFDDLPDWERRITNYYYGKA